MSDTTPDTPRTEAVMIDPNRDGNDIPHLARTLERELNAATAEVERLRERITELENRNGRLNRSQVDMKNDLFRLRAETHAIRNQNADDSLTLATLYDMVLGEDWGDNSNEKLIRAVGLLKRSATTKESLTVQRENP
jgi:chromosome segregation ATPase